MKGTTERFLKKTYNPDGNLGEFTLEEKSPSNLNWGQVIKLLDDFGDFIGLKALDTSSDSESPKKAEALSRLEDMQSDLVDIAMSMKPASVNKDVKQFTEGLNKLVKTIEIFREELS